MEQLKLLKLHMYEQSHVTSSPMLQQLSQSSSSPELKVIWGIFP